jgi:dTDP-4-amino-4,6-dideoxygalactose transaminase
MIRLAKPEIEGSIEAVRSVLRDGFLIQGKHVERFEEMVASYVGRRHAVAVNSGTSAIQCALMALGIGEGDEVAVPDFTFPATANAVVACGATPVLVDIDLATFNVSLESLKSKLSERTKALMPVDLFGLAADIHGIEDVARGRDILVVEDSACALGSSIKAKMCGAFGEASVVSFHPRKIVTTGEGGMVLTDSTACRDAVRRLRDHGIDRSRGTPEFVIAGYNLRMTEIQGCLGVDQMDRIGSLIEARRRVAQLYNRLLGGQTEVTLPTEPEGFLHTYQSYVVLLSEDVDRDTVIARMKAVGVETAIGTYSIHEQPFYRSVLGCRPGSLPRSGYAFRHSLALPIYESMGEETVGEVVSRLKECIQAAKTGK